MAFELVQKASPPEVRVGSGFRHFSVAVPSIEVALQRAAARGAAIIEGSGWEAGEVYIQVCMPRMHAGVRVLLCSARWGRTVVILRVAARGCYAFNFTPQPDVQLPVT